MRDAMRERESTGFGALSNTGTYIDRVHASLLNENNRFVSCVFQRHIHICRNTGGIFRTCAQKLAVKGNTRKNYARTYIIRIMLTTFFDFWCFVWRSVAWCFASNLKFVCDENMSHTFYETNENWFSFCSSIYCIKNSQCFNLPRDINDFVRKMGISIFTYIRRWKKF